MVVSSMTSLGWMPPLQPADIVVNCPTMVFAGAALIQPEGFVGAGLGVGVGVAVGGTDVKVAVGTDVKVAVGTDVKVAVGTDVKVAVGTDVKVAVGTDVKVAVGTDVKVAVGGTTGGGVQVGSGQTTSPNSFHSQSLSPWCRGDGPD